MIEDTQAPQTAAEATPQRRRLMTKTEYASHRGCSKSAISRAIRSGRIATVRVDGRELVDPVHADRQWESTTRARVDAPGPDHAADGTGANLRDELRAVRLARERAILELQNLEIDRQAGALIEYTAVAKFVVDAVTEFRTAFEALPDRMAPQLAGASDPAEVHRLLSAEIEHLLTLVADRFGAVADVGAPNG